MDDKRAVEKAYVETRELLGVTALAVSVLLWLGVLCGILWLIATPSLELVPRLILAGIVAIVGTLGNAYFAFAVVKARTLLQESIDHVRILS